MHFGRADDYSRSMVGKKEAMNKRILITYATKYGSTKEIAEKIGEVIGQVGLQVDVLPVKSVCDFTPYGAVYQAHLAEQAK